MSNLLGGIKTIILKGGENMIKNMSTLDRSIRIIVAVVLIWLNIAGTISGIWGMIAWLIAIIFVVTSAIGYCPLYQLLKISTKK